MGKLTRDDSYQGPEPGEVVTEHLDAPSKVTEVQQPARRIFTHLFDYEVDQVHPLYTILDEGAHYCPQWIGPPAEQLQECVTIQEAIERCQAHYDSLSERTGP